MRFLISLIILTIASLGLAQQQHTQAPISVEQLDAAKVGLGLTRILRENPVASRDALFSAIRSGSYNSQTDKVEIIVKKIAAAAPREDDIRLIGRSFKVDISVNRYGQMKDYICDLVIGDVPVKVSQKYGWIQCHSDIDALNFNVMANGFLETDELF